jgi:hypothetical protein
MSQIHMRGFFNARKVENLLSNLTKNFAQGSKRKKCVRVAYTPGTPMFECVHSNSTMTTSTFFFSLPRSDAGQHAFPRFSAGTATKAGL